MLKKAYISKVIFSNLYENAALSTYLCIIGTMTHRRIAFGSSKTAALKATADKLKVGVNTLRNHIKIMEGFNLCYEHNNQIIFRSNEELDKLYPKENGKQPKKLYFIFENRAGLKKIIRNIPILSNLRRQEKYIECNSKHRNIISKIENNFPVSKAERKFLSKFNADREQNQFTFLSNKAIATKVNRKSLFTSVRRKKELVQAGLISYHRREALVMTNVSEQDFRIMQREELIPYYCKYRNGDIIKDATSELRLTHIKYFLNDSYCCDVALHGSNKEKEEKKKNPKER